MSEQKRPRGNPNWVKGGPSPNPTGQSAEQRAARDAIRAALAGKREMVHDALIALIEAGNERATIYAHQVLHGKEPDTFNVEHSGSVENPAKPLTTEELVAIARATKT